MGDNLHISKLIYRLPPYYPLGSIQIVGLNEWTRAIFSVYFLGHYRTHKLKARLKIF